MQVNSGLRSILAAPWVYRTAMAVLRKNGAREWFANEILHVSPGQKVIDFGCGTGELAGLLPPVEFIGLDVSTAYVEAARAKFPRAVFIDGNVEQWLSDERLRNADLVVFNGVLHHVGDEEVTAALQFARQALSPSGRAVFYEPCFLAWQSSFSRRMMSLDRGQGIRTEARWKDLVSTVFPNLQTRIAASVNRLGYTCIIGECRINPMLANSG